MFATTLTTHTARARVQAPTRARTHSHADARVVRASSTPSRAVHAADSTTRRRALASTASLALALVMTPANAHAKDGKNGVYFIEPRGDNPVVGQEFVAKFGVKGYELAPASAGLQEGTGHHHLIIDGPAFVEKGQEIPFDDTHLHFGKAQKEGTVKLSPGEHTLTLQVADAKHRSFGKKFAKRITVVVE